MKKTIFYSTIINLVFFVSLQNTHGQDTLPSFSVIERSGKIIIGWINPNPELKQIIIQRSFDSSKGFRSIISMPDPTAYTNGYLDKPADSATYYYRLFCTKPGGRYFFTETKKAIKEKTKTITSEESALLKSISSEEFVLNATTAQKIQLGKQIGNIIDPGKIDKTIKKDSVINENIFQPSGLIFTNAEGNLIIVLPDPEKKNFSLFVYQEDGEIVFRMKNIKESKLLIDKSNFISSGWFKYELFEGQKSKEKNKFFIPPQNK
jgi:hypothetical protein